MDRGGALNRELGGVSGRCADGQLISNSWDRGGPHHKEGDQQNPVLRERESTERSMQSDLGPMSNTLLSIWGLCKIPLYLWGNLSFFLAIWHFEPPFVVWGSSPPYECWRKAETPPTVLARKADCSLSQPSLQLECRWALCTVPRR